MPTSASAPLGLPQSPVPTVHLHPASRRSFRCSVSEGPGWASAGQPPSPLPSCGLCRPPPALYGVCARCAWQGRLGAPQAGTSTILASSSSLAGSAEACRGLWRPAGGNAGGCRGLLGAQQECWSAAAWPGVAGPLCRGGFPLPACLWSLGLVPVSPGLWLGQVCVQWGEVKACGCPRGAVGGWVLPTCGGGTSAGRGGRWRPEEELAQNSGPSLDLGLTVRVFLSKVQEPLGDCHPREARPLPLSRTCTFPRV